MTLSNESRILERTDVIGTGNATLNGTTSKYRAFSPAVTTNDDSFEYVIVRQDSTNEWEHGIGHLSAASTLVRDSVIRSSNSNNLVSFTAGTKDVFVTAMKTLSPATALAIFGDGSDGASSPSSGTVQLTDHAYFTNYTPSGTSVLNVGSFGTAASNANSGFVLHCSDTLDISNITVAGTIRSESTSQNSAGTQTPQANGGAGGGGGGSTGAGTAGKSDGTGGSAGSGGSASAGATVTPRRIRHLIWSLLWMDGTPIYGGGNGGRNSSGSATGGIGGGILVIKARRVRRSGSTAASAIRARGVAGTTGSAGSGGGGGGGGGWIIVMYEQLLGSAATNCCDANGGAGGDGNGTGDGGGGGAGGRITFFNVHTGVITESAPTSGTDGTAASPGLGGAGGTRQASL